MPEEKMMIDVDRKEIGQRLKKFRMSQGFTQEQFSEFLSTGRANLSRVEKGETFPNHEILKLMRHKFHIKMDWLLFGLGMPIAGADLLNYESEIEMLVDRLLDVQQLDSDKNNKLLMESFLTDTKTRNVLLRTFFNHYYRDDRE